MKETVNSDFYLYRILKQMNSSHNARRMEAFVRKKITYSTGLVDIRSKIDYLLPGQTCSSVKHNNFASYKMLLYHCLEESNPMKLLKKEDIGNLENTTYMPNKDQEYMLPWKMVDSKQSYNGRKKSAIYL